MVLGVFVHRMSAKTYLHYLQARRELFPKAVHLATYYFLGAANIDLEVREAFRALLDETKPPQ
jgi:hypothetical protein